MPAKSVVCEIRIEQPIPEPSGSLKPGDSQVFHKKGCRQHANPIVHPARMEQFTHSCVDHGKTGASGLPFFKCLWFDSPWEVAKLATKRFFRRLWEMNQQVVGELPPSDLLEKSMRPTGTVAHGRVL
ncbi:MAG: hypothetical protein BWY82_02223 [Verrucomicrobia bacterium ADurb.Bin474]|nr:MAG: hypothetical protein BWY82_02223 [Verrucomicrobia bacterium ADurb.Bin474]